MPALTPAVVFRLGCYVVLGIFLVLAVGRCQPPDDENPAYDAIVVALNRRIAADAVALDAARKALAEQQSAVRTSLVRYAVIRDTLVITDTASVKVFVAQADSVVRSCRQLSESCDQFRVRADSSLAGLSLDRDRWRLEATSLRAKSRPSTLDLFVRRTLPVLAFVGGVYVGSQVTR